MKANLQMRKIKIATTLSCRDFFFAIDAEVIMAGHEMVIAWSTIITFYLYSFEKTINDAWNYCTAIIRRYLCESTQQG